MGERVDGVYLSIPKTGPGPACLAPIRLLCLSKVQTKVSGIRRLITTKRFTSHGMVTRRQRKMQRRASQVWENWQNKHCSFLARVEMLGMEDFASLSWIEWT